MVNIVLFIIQVKFVSLLTHMISYVQDSLVVFTLGRRYLRKSTTIATCIEVLPTEFILLSLPPLTHVQKMYRLSQCFRRRLRLFAFFTLKMNQVSQRDRQPPPVSLPACLLANQDSQTRNHFSLVFFFFLFNVLLLGCFLFTYQFFLLNFVVLYFNLFLLLPWGQIKCMMSSFLYLKKYLFRLLLFL